MKRGVKSCRLGVRLALSGVLSALAAPCLAQAVAQEGLREVSSLQTVRKDQRLMLGFSNAAQSAHSNAYVHNAASVPPGAAAAGLIGALVGAMLTRSGNVSRAEQVQQMNLLSDQALASLQNKLRPLLREELAARQLHEATELEHVDDPMDLDQPGMLRRVQEPLIMTSEFSCRFDESFKRLKISLAMKVWRKGELRPVNEQVLDHVSSELGEEGKKAFLRWTQEESKYLHEQVLAGAQQLSRQLTEALAGSGSKPLAAGGI